MDDDQYDSFVTDRVEKKHVRSRTLNLKGKREGKEKKRKTSCANGLANIPSHPTSTINETPTDSPPANENESGSGLTGTQNRYVRCDATEEVSTEEAAP
ncbi:hypothetical protein RUM44_013838 [Polyplax serrata]|uniref:Uncharacterized protein n=1 Tax=Polyplax serrata TaxID=468196 RepID=A0ABR1BHF9_POLSC